MDNVMKILFVKDWYQEKGYCDLTREMDEYVLYDNDLGRWGTYIYDFGDREKEYWDRKKGHVYVMRLPGATRGQMVTDENNCIEILEFYEDTCYEKLAAYDRAMDNIKEKYIGRKIIVEYEIDESK